MAIGQVGSVHQCLDRLPPHVLEYRAVIQNLRANFRIIDIEVVENRHIEANLARIVQDYVGRKTTHRLAQDGLGSRIANQVTRRDALCSFEQSTVQEG